MGVCYSACPSFRPDWAWSTPEGFRDELFVWNWSFTVPGNGSIVQGLPVQADDDADFYMRAIFCPQLAIVPRSLYGDAYTPRNTGFMRLSTSDGRQLSRDLLLTMGYLCAGGFAGEQGFGGSLVDDLRIPRGGAVSLDVQLGTNAKFAEEQQAFGASTMRFYANVYGTSGNGRTVELINPGAPNVALSAAAISNGIQVTLGTNGAGTVTSTVAQVVAIINDTSAVAALVLAHYDGPGTDLASAVGPLALVGGEASENIQFSGAFLGYKRFAVC